MAIQFAAIARPLCQRAVVRERTPVMSFEFVGRNTAALPLPDHRRSLAWTALRLWLSDLSYPGVGQDEKTFPSCKRPCPNLLARKLKNRWPMGSNTPPQTDLTFEAPAWTGLAAG
jgi:hypothetical protein